MKKRKEIAIKTVSEIEKHIIGKIQEFNFELETTEGYFRSCQNNYSFKEKRGKEITELKIKIKTLEELLKEIKE